MCPAQKKKPKSGAPTAFSRLKQQLQAVDVLFEVRDARLPKSSRHPKAGEIFGNKPRLIVLAKQDLADPEALKEWLKELSAGENEAALAISLKLNKGQDKIVNEALRLTTAKRESLARKGLLPRPMRACVVGLPNVGKSSLINWLIGKRKTKVGDRPGITTGNQWVRVHPQLELLDTPGLLPPTAFTAETSLKLSLCNILPNDRYDIEEVASQGLSTLAALDGDLLKLYGTSLVESEPTLENLARARSCLGTGGRLDTRRAASIFLSDFRSGRLGRVVLDRA
jgi:ribosome biogenesis GTPase A